MVKPNLNHKSKEQTPAPCMMINYVINSIQFEHYIHENFPFYNTF